MFAVTRVNCNMLGRNHYYRIYPKHLDGKARANSVDLDQTSQNENVASG